MLPPDLLAILVCPKSKQPLVYFPRGEDNADEHAGFLLCPASRLRYPVQDGVPVMLIDEATELTQGQVDVLISKLPT